MSVSLLPKAVPNSVTERLPAWKKLTVCQKQQILFLVSHRAIDNTFIHLYFCSEFI